MEQSITLKIAGKEFPMKASSPEMESLMRRAAERINESLAKYDEKFPRQSQLDKLIFVALNETAVSLSLRDQAAAVTRDIGELEALLGSYLKDIKDDR